MCRCYMSLFMNVYCMCRCYMCLFMNVYVYVLHVLIYECLRVGVTCTCSQAVFCLALGTYDIITTSVLAHL